MPELPEVEVTRLGLLQGLPGHTVQALWTSGLELRETVSRARLRTHLLGERIITVDRRAKYLLFRFSSGAVLRLHLGMTGKLALLAGKEPRQKHDHFELALDGACVLRLNDARRFGGLALWPAKTAEEEERAFSAGEGLEPLSLDFTAEALFSLACGRRVSLKTLLMNGHLIAGIGNIYANEILFAAGLHPERAAKTLGPAHCERIVTAAKRILRAAIAAGGSTISDFLGASGKPGYFQLQLQVYGRGGQPCPRCGATIRQMKSNGRSTWFCPNCQKMR